MSGLQDAKVGDLLVVGSGHLYGESLVRVASVGKVHVTTTKGSKYAIKNGRAAGSAGAWRPDFASIATPADITRVRVRHAQEKLKSVVITPETLEAALQFIKLCTGKEDQQ